MLMHQSEWGTWLYHCVCITLQLPLVAVFGTAMLMHQSEWGTWLYHCVCITLQLPCGVYELELETHALM